MPDYRVYIIGREGHFLGAKILSKCPDDDSAKRAAEQLVDGHGVELWDRDRLVARFAHKPR
jgi:hypothetical protein